MALSSMSLAVMVKAIWLQLIMPLHMDKLTITGTRLIESQRVYVGKIASS